MKNDVPASALIRSENFSWGFHWTARMDLDLSPVEITELYDAVARVLIEAGIASGPEQAVLMLDSKAGRHFSDDMSHHGAQSGLSVAELRLAAVATLNSRPYWKKTFARSI